MIRPKSAKTKSLIIRSSNAAHESRYMVIERGDKKFYMGLYRNEIFSEIAKNLEIIKWLLAQSDLSMKHQEFLI